MIRLTIAIALLAASLAGYAVGRWEASVTESDCRRRISEALIIRDSHAARKRDKELERRTQDAPRFHAEK